MTSRPEQEAFVWVWLPGGVEPVVAGRLSQQGSQLVFNYGQSYLQRDNAIALYDKELPLKPGILPLLPGLTMPGCIRDASPDAWGRRVIINRMMGRAALAADNAELSELSYLLESGSDRIGALDFQRSATEYVPRLAGKAQLEELMASVSRVEQGVPLSPALDQALNHGTSIGGARPKALIEADDARYIAKFSSSTDITNVVKAEFVAMKMAARVGLEVAPVRLVKAGNRDVLLIERFDRVQVDDRWQRRAMVSALTLLGLDEMMARYASYEDMAEIIRHRFLHPRATLHELFGRIVFNILCGNTDDHARNHAAFWDGQYLRLTPAYDICPQGRTGNEATQSMLISGSNRMSRLAVCREAAHQFQLSRDEADAIIQHQVDVITAQWAAICDEAELTAVERSLMWQRQFLNPFVFQ
jgi:serine/threonine-protein kinase HipA